jgi:hypothetical protein
MSAKNFRFRSPGIRIEELDQSAIDNPVLAEVGPVIVGRSQQGPIMKPVVVNSVDEFIRVFGVPAAGGLSAGDGWRDENTTSPHYGAHAAVAYLRNAAPVTFIRLGGYQHPNATSDGYAGWKTTYTTPSGALPTNGGAHGLWLLPSASNGKHGTGSLAAVFYIDEKAGLSVGTASNAKTHKLFEFSEKMNTADIDIYFTSSIAAGYDQIQTKQYKVSLNPDKANFIRKAMNTSPVACNSALNDKRELFWVGETFEDNIKKLADANTNEDTLAFITALEGTGKNKADYRYPAQAAKTGYVFSQDLGVAGSFEPIDNPPQRLFRLIGLTEGSWASKNLKISISNIRYTKVDSAADPYPTFSVQVRGVSDRDDAPEILEAFDDLNLNPRSSDYVARRIGDQYLKLDQTTDKFDVVGEFPNRSRYIRVEMHPTVKAGNANPELVPFGFLGPARRQKFQICSGALNPATGYLNWSGSYASSSVAYSQDTTGVAKCITSNGIAFTGSLEWPDYLLRVTASNATRGLARGAYFGVRTTREDTGRYYSRAYLDLTYPLEGNGAGAALDSWEKGDGTVHTFAFSLDDVRQASSSAKGWQDDAVYKAGNRKSGTAGEKSISSTGIYYKAEGAGAASPVKLYSNTSEGWKTVLDAGYNKFTMPLHGGLDGVDIKQKDPFSIDELKDGASSDGRKNYAWYSVLTAIKMFKDPEFLDADVAAMPGIMEPNLNVQLADYARERGDMLAVLDLDSQYRPLETLKPSEIGSNDKRGTVSGAVNHRRGDLAQVNHSYACTFYPWVDIVDTRNDATVAVPPSVPMLGVFGRVKQTSDVWFAPAGFNRGGLSSGLAGVTVVNVKDRLTSSERDDLYDNGINPIANFPSEGIVVFGQKTLQLERSALDRINVRRLLIFLRRRISAIAKTVLFEQNVQATWTDFTEGLTLLKEQKMSWIKSKTDWALWITDLFWIVQPLLRILLTKTFFMQSFTSSRQEQLSLSLWTSSCQILALSSQNNLKELII